MSGGIIACGCLVRAAGTGTAAFLTPSGRHASIRGPVRKARRSVGGFLVFPCCAPPKAQRAPGAMQKRSASIRAVILDLDGVIYRGRTAIPGAPEAAAWLTQNSYRLYFFTNNASKTRESYVELLACYGITADSDHIVTSGSLTAQYFSDNGLLPATALVVGEGGLADELRAVGVRVVRRRGKRPVDFVVVAMDRKFTYRKLHEAQQAIRSGAKFIATNRDATYPVEGNVIPGGGSIVAAVATAAQQEPLVIGKPSPGAGELITRHAGIKANQALMVGDRLETDIEMGRRAGLWTCLVLTGISRAEDAPALPEEHRPHWIIEGIGQLPDLLASLATGGDGKEGDRA